MTSDEKRCETCPQCHGVRVVTEIVGRHGFIRTCNGLYLVCPRCRGKGYVERHLPPAHPETGDEGWRLNK